MKKILILFLVLAVSCTKVGPTSVEVYRVTDTFEETSSITLANCTISPFLEGENMVRIHIENDTYYPVEKKRCFAELDTYLTTRDFQRELRWVNQKSREEATLQFSMTAKNLRITWKMFDQIYSKYEQIY